MNCYAKKDSCRARSGGTALTYLTVLLLAGAAHGQEAIGSATSITPQAEGSHGGKHTLATGGNVYHQDDSRASCAPLRWASTNSARRPQTDAH